MEQTYNENQQDNTIRNLLIILIIAVIAVGASMVYNASYNSSSQATTKSNAEKVDLSDISGNVNSVYSFLKSFYHDLNPVLKRGVDSVAVVVGAIVATKVVWRIIRRRK